LPQNATDSPDEEGQGRDLIPFSARIKISERGSGRAQGAKPWVKTTNIFKKFGGLLRKGTKGEWPVNSGHKDVPFVQTNPESTRHLGEMGEKTS